MQLPKSGVLFGARVVIDGKYPESDLSGVYQREADLGRKLSVVTTFRDFQEFDYDAEAELIAGGRIPQISWPTRDTYPGHAAILSGACDALLKIEASKWAALKKPVLIRAFWEMNGSSYGDDPENFVLAWQHIWKTMKPLAANTTWVWCVMARASSADHRWVEFWPGTHYVGVIGIDAYDHNPLDRYLSQILHMGDYNAPRQNNDWYQTFTSPTYSNKPLMVCEGGQREITDPTNEKAATLSKAAWWNHVVPDLKTNPRVKLFVPWDVKSSGGDWRFDTTPTPGHYDVGGETFAAVKTAANDPWMNPVQ